jgi:hypothetical protein
MANLTEVPGAEPARLSGGYVDWPAIFAGTALAVALSFVLLTFGSAIGLSSVSFEPREGVSRFWLGIVSGLWFLWVAITAFAAGGYLAGRLRRPVAGASVDESELRDGSHGILVWATGVLLGAVLAVSGVTGVIGAAGRAAGGATEAATQAINGDLDYIGSRLMRTTTPEAGAAEGGTTEGLDSQATTLITRSLASGTLAPDDRDYLAGIVAQRTGQTPEEAQAQVDEAFAEAQQLYEQAVDAAEQARVATAIAAFLIAATLLASGAAAYLAATTGGDHRDRNLAFGKW